MFINDAIGVLFNACIYKIKNQNEIFNVGGNDPKDNLKICKEIKYVIGSKSKIKLLKKKIETLITTFICH